MGKLGLGGLGFRGALGLGGVGFRGFRVLPILVV